MVKYEKIWSMTKQRSSETFVVKMENNLVSEIFPVAPPQTRRQVSIHASTLLLLSWVLHF